MRSLERFRRAAKPRYIVWGVAEHHGAEGHAEEAIHLPSPTIAPATVGLGVTLLTFGVIFGLPLIIAGAVFFVLGLAIWLINDAREFVRAGEHGDAHGGHS